jgi:hypothetical protein
MRQNWQRILKILITVKEQGMSGNVQKRSLAVLVHLIFQLGKILKVNFSFEHSFLQYHDLIEHNQAHDLI